MALLAEFYKPLVRRSHAWYTGVEKEVFAMPDRPTAAPRRSYHNNYLSLFAALRILEQHAAPDAPLTIAEILARWPDTGSQPPSYGTLDTMLQQLAELLDPEAENQAVLPEAFLPRLVCVIAHRQNGRTQYLPWRAWTAQYGGGTHKLNQARRYYLKPALSHGEWFLLSEVLLTYPHVTQTQTQRFLHLLDLFDRRHPPRAASRYVEKHSSKRLFEQLALLDGAIRAHNAVTVRCGRLHLDERTWQPVPCDPAEAEALTLAPRAVLHQQGRYYLAGLDLANGQLRCLRLDEVLSISLLKDRTVPPPAELDPDALRHLCAAPAPGPLLAVRLCCDETLLRPLADTFGPQGLFRKRDDGRLEVSLRASAVIAKQFALQHAAQVQVLEPETLRQEVAETLRYALQQYQP